MSETQTSAPQLGVLCVALTEPEAQALAVLCCRLSRSKLIQYRHASTKEQARTMAAALDCIRAALLTAGVDLP